MDNEEAIDYIFDEISPKELVIYLNKYYPNYFNDLKIEINKDK